MCNILAQTQTDWKIQTKYNQNVFLFYLLTLFQHIYVFEQEFQWKLKDFFQNITANNTAIIIF